MCVELKRRWFERAQAMGLAPGSEEETRETQRRQKRR